MKLKDLQITPEAFLEYFGQRVRSHSGLGLVDYLKDLYETDLAELTQAALPLEERMEVALEIIKDATYATNMFGKKIENSIYNDLISDNDRHALNAVETIESFVKGDIDERELIQSAHDFETTVRQYWKTTRNKLIENLMKGNISSMYVISEKRKRLKKICLKALNRFDWDRYPGLVKIGRGSVIFGE